MMKGGAEVEVDDLSPTPDTAPPDDVDVWVKSFRRAPGGRRKGEFDQLGLGAGLPENLGDRHEALCAVPTRPARKGRWLGEGEGERGGRRRP